MPQNEPALFNQALMEFGALQCVPKSPNCGACVFHNSCAALAHKQVNELPFKSKKTKVTERHLNYLVFQDEVQHALIQKRIGKGIWQNLYEFPCIESLHTLAIDELVNHIADSAWATHSIQKISELNPVAITHLLSHQRLRIKFWKIQVEGQLDNGLNYDEIRAHPFPVVLYNFIANDWQEL
jgi:A/G-specific adenine glycosylase